MGDRFEDTLVKSLTSIIASSLIVFIGMIFGNVLGLMLQIILGRTLQPRLYGVYSLGVGIVDIVSSFAVLGMGAILARQIPRYLVTDKDRVLDSISIAWLFSFGFGIILSLLLAVMSRDIAMYVFKDETLGFALVLFSFVLPFLSFRKVSGGIPRGFKRPLYKVILEDLGFRTIFIMTFILLLLFDVGPLTSAITAFIMAQVFISTGYFVLTLRLLREHGAQLRFTLNLKEGKCLLKMSLPLFFSGFSFLFITYTDRIFLSIYRTSSDVGIYSAALAIATLISAVVASFNFLFLPLVSEHLSKGESDIVVELYSFVAKWEFIITLPLIVFFSTNTWFLGKIYGPQYGLGEIALIVLSIGISTSGFLGLAGNILVAIGKTKLNLVAEIIGAVLNILLNYLLIPDYGIIGAALATSASLFIRNLSLFMFSRGFFGASPYSRAIYIKTLLAGLVLWGYSYVMNTFFVSWIFLIALFSVGVAGYLIGLYRLKVITRTESSISRALLKILSERSNLFR